ncbi:hypothetical protein GCM10022406_19460 [Hymenobacter algoricola]|uniref:Uncharacterized protein n=1 Tax=Hymenobacter algoricola TaxID=486267 RepID=A0ABP7N4J3_9BACT
MPRRYTSGAFGSVRRASWCQERRTAWPVGGVSGRESRMAGAGVTGPAGSACAGFSRWQLPNPPNNSAPSRKQKFIWSIRMELLYAKNPKTNAGAAILPILAPASGLTVLNSRRCCKVTRSANIAPE